MTRRKPEILIITDENGDTDWQTDPAHRDSVHIVHIDYRNLDGLLPDQLEDIARSVQHLSKAIPWRAGVLKDLQSRHADAVDDIETGNTYAADARSPNSLDESHRPHTE